MRAAPCGGKVPIVKIEKIWRIMYDETTKSFLPCTKEEIRLADEWKYGQQSLRRPGDSLPYRGNTPLMRPISGDLLRRREPPVTVHVDPQEGSLPPGNTDTAPVLSPWAGYSSPYVPSQGDSAGPAMPQPMPPTPQLASFAFQTQGAYPQEAPVLKPSLSQDEEDWDDGFEDMARPAPQRPLPPPVTVPVSAPTLATPKKRWGGVLALLLVVLLAGSAAALYFSGVLDSQLTQAGIPTWLEMKARIQAAEETGSSVHEVSSAQLRVTSVPMTDARREEAQALERVLENSGASILPVGEGLASLKDFSVSVKEAQAPATLVFTLQTNVAVSDIRLLTPSNQPLAVSSTRKVPTGDGLTWLLAVNFDQPFTGEIRAFLRYDTSIWTAGGMSCSVDVKAPESSQ